MLQVAFVVTDDSAMLPGGVYDFLRVEGIGYCYTVCIGHEASETIFRFDVPRIVRIVDFSTKFMNQSADIRTSVNISQVCTLVNSTIAT